MSNADNVSGATLRPGMSPAEAAPTAVRSDAVRGRATERLGALDVARGVCIVLVVFLHVQGEHFVHVVQQGWVGHFWDLVASATRPIRIPAFFLISGFLAANAVKRSWPDAVEKRILPLLYVYVLWSAIYAVQNTIQDYARGQEVGLISVGMFLAKLPYPISPLWFIYALLAYFVLARLLRDIPQAYALGFAAIVSAFAEHLPAPASYIARGFFFFLLGAYVPTFVMAVLARVSWRNAALASLAYCAATILILKAGPHVPGIWLPASMAGIVFLILCSALVVDTTLGFALRAVGTRTLPIFVLHTILIAAWAAIVAGPGKPFFAWVLAQPALALIYPALLLALIVGGSLGIYWLSRATGHGWLFELPDRYRRLLMHKLMGVRLS